MAGLGSSLRLRGARCLAQRDAPSALLQCRRTCVTSTEEQLATTVKVHRMIRLFREQGHCIAKQDPLDRPRWTLVEAPELALLLKRPEEPDLAAPLPNRQRGRALLFGDAMLVKLVNLREGNLESVLRVLPADPPPPSRSRA